MAKAIGIVDEANEGAKDDNLGIETHTKSLIRFINATNTPITVGIQGEWGSGKTSLINKIHHHFDQPDQERIKQIWINSWEYSLLSTPEEALLKIVNKIIDELVGADQNTDRIKQIKGGAQKIFEGALRIGAQAALGSEAANVAKELIGSSHQSISELRKQLGDVVKEMADRSSNPYEKVIIYVDDLDRIEPKNAVAILELLKNIFSVPKCVFILAIDYQVVVKGLEHKFGKQTPENEWEFRAFFDKIIQLPFMMPMGQYDIGKYVNSLLLEIGFVEGEGLDDDSVREIILRTIGGNPRSIKRLVNSVSLIQIFAEEKKKTETNESGEASLDEGDEKMLLFALLCLQIAYPAIYSLLLEAPDFAKWDDSFALKQTNRSEERMGDNDRLTPEAMKKIFEEEFKAAQDSGNDFDEDWEQVLYRICYGRPRLKPRVSDISMFFSYIKDDLIGKEKQGVIGATIERIMTETSVTSVTSTDQGQSTGQFKDAEWKSADDKALANQLWNKILDVLQDTTTIYKRGRRSGSSGVIRLSDKSVYPGVIFGMSQGPGFYLYISFSAPDETKGAELMEKLMGMKDNIEQQFGESLEWRYQPDKRAQYIYFHPWNVKGSETVEMVKSSDGEIVDSRFRKNPDQPVPDEESWDLVIAFFQKYGPRFEKTFVDALTQIREQENS